MSVIIGGVRTNEGNLVAMAAVFLLRAGGRPRPSRWGGRCSRWGSRWGGRCACSRWSSRWGGRCACNRWSGRPRQLIDDQRLELLQFAKLPLHHQLLLADRLLQSLDLLPLVIDRRLQLADSLL